LTSFIILICLYKKVIVLQVFDSMVMDQLQLDNYLKRMADGEWGDGIMLSAAVRLYGRPIVVITPNGQEQVIDTANKSGAERITLGLINGNHYVSIIESISDVAVTETSSQDAVQMPDDNDSDVDDNDVLSPRLSNVNNAAVAAEEMSEMPSENQVAGSMLQVRMWYVTSMYVRLLLY